MKHWELRRLVQLALLTAVTVAIAMLVHIPSPFTKEVIVLIDAGILLSGALFKTLGGAIVGGLAGFLFDLLSGYPEWALFSLVIHSVQGMLFGQLYARGNRVLAYVVSSIWLMIGYACVSALFYGIASVLGSLQTNLIQVIASTVVVIPLIPQLKARLKGR